MYESITREEIYSIIKSLSQINYDTMGDILFKDSGYSKIVFNNIITYSNVSTSMYNSNCTYKMKIIILKNVKMLRKTWGIKKCNYCGNRKCDAKLNCCGKNVHIDCANHNNCQCNCSNKKKSDIQIVLKKDNKTYNDDNMCSVCFENCDVTTECGHCVCKKCLNKIYQDHGSESKCPICRCNVIKKIERSIEQIFDISLKDGTNIKVDANIIIQ